MADQPVVPVSRLLDERGLGSFQIVLLIWSFFLVLIDGYDIAAIAFAAPHLIKEWHISPKALGPVFSASLVGILFGSALFGWIGDRYGRKASLIAANLVFGSDSRGGPRLLMVDGFGEKGAIPLSSMSRVFNRHFIYRRYRRMLRGLSTPVEGWTTPRTAP